MKATVDLRIAFFFSLFSLLRFTGAMNEMGGKISFPFQIDAFFPIFKWQNGPLQYDKASPRKPKQR